MRQKVLGLVAVLHAELNDTWVAARDVRNINSVVQRSRHGLFQKNGLARHNHPIEYLAVGEIWRANKDGVQRLIYAERVD